jgi:hypothetical protein
VQSLARRCFSTGSAWPRPAIQTHLHLHLHLHRLGLASPSAASLTVASLDRCGSFLFGWLHVPHNSLSAGAGSTLWAYSASKTRGSAAPLHALRPALHSAQATNHQFLACGTCRQPNMTRETGTTNSRKTRIRCLLTLIYLNATAHRHPLDFIFCAGNLFPF